MTKILEINKCEECKYVRWYSIHDFNYCGFKNTYTLKSAKKRELEMEFLPDWCPLSDKEEM